MVTTQTILSSMLQAWLFHSSLMAWPIITLAMACGALRMIERRVMVRHFPAVDTLGCMSVICCDKTGTLTKNRMTVEEILCSGQHWVFNGNEYMLANSGMALENKPDKKFIEKLFLIACLCNNAVLQGKSSDGRLAVGDSTECALLIGLESRDATWGSNCWFYKAGRNPI
ncbi:MAG: hypothetical protein RQM92_08185 [Candidatus Syntrophopropionicum ammoniitolerans]